MWFFGGFPTSIQGWPLQKSRSKRPNRRIFCHFATQMCMINSSQSRPKLFKTLPRTLFLVCHSKAMSYLPYLWSLVVSRCLHPVPPKRLIWPILLFSGWKLCETFLARSVAVFPGCLDEDSWTVDFQFQYVPMNSLGDEYLGPSPCNSGFPVGNPTCGLQIPRFWGF